MTKNSETEISRCFWASDSAVTRGADAGFGGGAFSEGADGGVGTGTEASLSAPRTVFALPFLLAGTVLRGAGGAVSSNSSSWGRPTRGPAFELVLPFVAFAFAVFARMDVAK